MTTPVGPQAKASRPLTPLGDSTFSCSQPQPATPQKPHGAVIVENGTLLTRATKYSLDV